MTEDEIANILADNIIYYMKRKKITGVRLAKESKLCVNVISQICNRYSKNGKHNFPKLSSLIRICNILNINLHDLLKEHSFSKDCRKYN